MSLLDCGCVLCPGYTVCIVHHQGSVSDLSSATFLEETWHFPFTKLTLVSISIID